MTIRRPDLLDALFALLAGLVLGSLLLVLSLVYGWFPAIGSVGRFQFVLLGALLVVGVVLAIPFYVAFDRWGLPYD